MTYLYLVRHGQTDWNIEDRWQGQIDVPLNARGRQQAEQVAAELAGEGISAIYASDLQRASQTAKALSRLTGLPVTDDPRLREINQGAWQGLLSWEVEARYADLLCQRGGSPLAIAAPGGETVLQVRQRLLAAVAEIVSRHPAQRVALVSHGFALAVLYVHYMGFPLESVWDYIPENDQWRVLEVQDSGPRKAQNGAK